MNIRRAPVQPITNDVRADSLRIRNTGGAFGLLAAALFFGGLWMEQPLILFAGMAVLVGTLIYRSRAKKRALASMPAGHSEAVAAEVERTAFKPVVKSRGLRIAINVVVCGAFLAWNFIAR